MSVLPWTDWRDGGRVTDYLLLHDEAERLAAVAKAKRWTREQAARLNMTPEAIPEAITRGWFPDQVEAVESKYALENDPWANGDLC